MARPTKLTPETQNKIVQALTLGATYEHAANFAGISYETFNNWMKRGEAASSGKFLQFFEAVKKAEGNATVGWLAKIEKAANDGNWQAAAWKLERRYPNDYGRQRIDNYNLNVDLSRATDEQLQRIANGEHPAAVMANSSSG